jgi:hypothetical protein
MIPLPFSSGKENHLFAAIDVGRAKVVLRFQRNQDGQNGAEQFSQIVPTRFAFVSRSHSPRHGDLSAGCPLAVEELELARVPI